MKRLLVILTFGLALILSLFTLTAYAAATGEVEVIHRYVATNCDVIDLEGSAVELVPRTPGIITMKLIDNNYYQQENGKLYLASPQGKIEVVIENAESYEISPDNKICAIKPNPIRTVKYYLVDKYGITVITVGEVCGIEWHSWIELGWPMP